MINHDAMIKLFQIEILLKMAKHNGDSGDIATLCHIISGAKVSTTYTTQNKCESEAGCTFLTLGVMQLGPAAHLLIALDVGNRMIKSLGLKS